MTSVRRSLRFSFIEKYATIFIGLVSYVLIARLLSPEDIGIYSVVAALAGMAQVIREFGVGGYLIQERQLSAAYVNAAATLTMWLGVIMLVVGWSSAGAIASFYADERLIEVVRVISLNFVLLPSCSVCTSLLRRGMRFKRLLVINLLGAVATLAVTLALAIAKQGPVSLAWGVVASNALTALLSMHALTPDERPNFFAWNGQWRNAIAFGRLSTPAAIISTLSNDLNDLAVGRVLGLAHAAIISRAMGLMNLFQRDMMAAVRNVTYPAFAKLHRDKVNVEPSFIYATSAITAASFTYFGFMALFPLEMLRIMAGPQWDAAAPLVPYFSAAGVFASISTLAPNAMLAAGHVKVVATADIVVGLCRVVSMLTALLLFHTMKSVAFGLMVGLAFSPIILMRAKQYCIGNNWGQLRHVLMRSAMVAILTLILPAGLSLNFGLGRLEPMPTWQFLLLCPTTVLIWVRAIQYCRHPIYQDPTFLRISCWLTKNRRLPWGRHRHTSETNT